MYTVYAQYTVSTESPNVITSLKPVYRPNALRDQVYEMLRDHLRNGSIVAGHPLQETQLAEQLGVSRTPVREALARLAAEGFLVSVGRSFILPAPSTDEVDDIYELRSLIEPAAIRRVAQFTADADARRPMEEALADACAAHEAGDTDAFRDANQRFRAAWVALLPNRHFVKAVEQYADYTQHVRALTLESREVWPIVLKGLKQIAAALAAGDGEAAAAAMRDHMAESKRSLLASLRSRSSRNR